MCIEYITVYNADAGQISPRETYKSQVGDWEPHVSQ